MSPHSYQVINHSALRPGATHNNQPGRHGRRPRISTCRSPRCKRNTQQPTREAMEEIAYSYASHMDEETAALSLRKRKDTQQPTTEARKEITYSYMPSPRWTRDMQQPTGEAREETAYFYASRPRWTRRPRHRVRKGGGTRNNQPGRQGRRPHTPTPCG